ncbi:MAG: DNA replication and repair protein RecF, partial [Synergistaceae bacterium]|nr:DNA replication and repair protein RecF [Synergistaceae bacterium]
RDGALASGAGVEKMPSSALSRGQKRRSVIALILASGRVMELKLKRKPLFLLDEVFSELDADARRIVADALFATGWQIFATSAEKFSPAPASDWRGEIYELAGGDIVKSRE